MNIKHLFKKGFTLIELLVVITIIAALAGIVLTNFLGVRQRAKDARRKAEMMQLKSALRLYYNDFGKYPKSAIHGIGRINVVDGCGSNGTGDCSIASNCTNQFAAGGLDGCANVYMKSFPTELGSKIFYIRPDPGDDQTYHMEASLENPSDPEALQSQARCPGSGGATCITGEYCVCPD